MAAAPTATTLEAPKQDSQHVAGLDSVRFVLATWVVLGHFVPGMPKGLWMHGPLAVVRLAVNNVFVGPAAVIGFFVVSGFCIHYPHRHLHSIRVLPFYVRREIRILIPLAAMLVLSRFVGVTMAVFTDSILWSLVCEEIYYFFYPALLVMFRRVGLLRVLASSFVVAYAIVLVRPNASGNYPSYGAAANWLVGLPCWLLGCFLAETIDQGRPARERVTPHKLWLTRATTLGAGMVCSVLRFHTPIKYPWSLDLFAVLCFFWLKAEIFYYRARPERPPPFERLGRASYSIYLVHVHAWVVWVALGLPDWLVPHLLFVFLFAYAFFRLVEAPSHSLARKTNRWIKQKTRAVATG